MTRLAWIVIAALAVVAGGCTDDNPLYTNPKYTPGYTPSGSSSIAHVPDKADWRARMSVRPDAS